MSSTLGEKLRQAREERGISISEVAEQTRISPLYIKSIEEDNYKPLPGGIFNKGFLKSYARFVGYDEHEALLEYSKIVTGGEQAVDEEFRSYRPEVLTDERSSASILPTILIAGAILVVMTAGVLLAVRLIRNQPGPTPTLTNVNSDANTSVLLSTEAPPANNRVPDGEALRVEFATASSPISVSAISDGKSSILLVTPDKPAVFETKQTIRLAYSKSLASAARLSVNGKSVALPQAPGNPKRAAIEVELTKDNIAQVLQNGAATALSAPAVSVPVRPQAAKTPQQVVSNAPARPTPAPTAAKPR